MKSTLRYKEKHDENPLVEVNKLFIDKDKYLIADNNNITLDRQQELEEIISRYVLFMAKNLKLSKKAKEVLKFIVNTRKKNNDRGIIDIEIFKEVSGYNSLGPIYAGINELVEKKLIARTNYNDIYFINPNYLWMDMVHIKLSVNNRIGEYQKEGYPLEVEGVIELDMLKNKTNQDLPEGFNQSQRIN